MNVVSQPRILVIQDISASCRISMNVAVPILSCLNNEVNILPTALLSTHTTSGFTDYTYLDLMDESEKILVHWKKLGIKFDGIVVGYLGSIHQLQVVEYIADEMMKAGGKLILDPVMGDNGNLYQGFGENYIAELRNLASRATITLPNITEASYLADYFGQSIDKNYQKNLIQKMAQINQNQVILTGVSQNEGYMGAMSYDLSTDKYHYHQAPYYPGHFEGGGDLFTSVIAGLILNGKSVHRAMQVAVDYVNKAIKRTSNLSDDRIRYGLQFETDIPYLIQESFNNE